MRSSAPRVLSRCRRRVVRSGCRLALVVVVLALAGAPLAGAAPAAAAANREPFEAAQWGLRQVGADVAWDVTRGGGARVGIVDTGIDLSHAELAGRVLRSTRCIGTGGQVARCGGSAQDDSGHGTHVAGIVAAPLDGVGVAGVAPDAGLLVVKALRADGSGEAADVAAGIDWLLEQGANVVNLSLAETFSPGRVQGSPLESAIRRAASMGAVVVLAAGNGGAGSDSATTYNLPAIVVGATDRSGRLAPYSHPLPSSVTWGLVAPGGDGTSGTEGEVVSTYWFAGRRNAYAWAEGTSMAAPHVSGAAALLASQGVRGQAASDRLLATAAAAACGPGCRGLLDARAAVGATVPAAPTVAATTAAGAPSAAPPARPGTDPSTVPPAAAQVSAATPVPPRVQRTPTGVPKLRAPQEAIGPIGQPARLTGPDDPGHRRLGEGAGVLVVVAGLALMGTPAGTVLWRRRRVRAGGRW